ncbi:MAG: hypothetical protein K2X77_03985 [Candidatus Obscuribacterales bacterium]|jgi:hypothetical protein|nr:hypothetical protein [Candidatus Obscuribacterales bacterium]
MDKSENTKSDPPEKMEETAGQESEQDILDKCRQEAWDGFDKKHGIKRDEHGTAVDEKGLPKFESLYGNENGEISSDGIPKGKGDPALLDGPAPDKVLGDITQWVAEQENAGSLDQAALAEKVINYAQFAMNYLQAQEHVDPEAASENYHKIDSSFGDLQRKLDGCHTMKVQPYMPWVFMLRE